MMKMKAETTLEMVCAWIESQKPTTRTVEGGYRAMIAAAPEVDRG